MTPPPRLSRVAALSLLALIGAGGFAGFAAAAPTLAGVNLGEYASGPKVRAADLKGRVVVVEYWGNTCAPCLAAIPHVAALQEKYPYQALIVVANQCWPGDAQDTAKVWAAHKGGAKVAVIHNGGLAKTEVKGVPHAFVFDAAGKLVFEGYPTNMDAAVEKAVKETPAGKAMDTAHDKAKALFGEGVPEPLMALAIQAADTSHSSAMAMQTLGRAAKAKDPKIADAAKTMLDSFSQAVAKKYDDAMAKADEDPVGAWNGMEEITKWAPQTPENTKAHEQMAKWRRDTTFLRELAADKLWLDLQAQAAKINFEAHPNAKPTSKLESDLKKLLTEKLYAGTKAIDKAKAVAADWKLDPATGRADKFKPKPKEAAKDATTETPAEKSPQ